MVAVARLAANAAGVPLVMITSTLRLTSSDASSVKRAAQPFAERYSMVVCGLGIAELA